MNRLNHRVSYKTHGSVGELILRQSENNALDYHTLKGLAEAFVKSRHQEDKCVLFKADGSNFTVGADLKYVRQLIDADDQSGFEKFSEAFQNVTRAMLQHPGIIIAGLHGWVIGGGFEITLTADLRFADEETKIKLPELAIGTMFSNASTKLLAQIIGLGRAKELMFLGDTIRAEKAHQIGLINRVCPTGKLYGSMQETAQKIIENVDAKALALAKNLINKNMDLPIQEVLDHEHKVLTGLGTHEEFKRKIKSILAK